MHAQQSRLRIRVAVAGAFMIIEEISSRVCMLQVKAIAWRQRRWRDVRACCCCQCACWLECGDVASDSVGLRSLSGSSVEIRFLCALSSSCLSFRRRASSLHTQTERTGRRNTEHACEGRMGGLRCVAARVHLASSELPFVTNRNHNSKPSVKHERSSGQAKAIRNQPNARPASIKQAACTAEGPSAPHRGLTRIPQTHRQGSTVTITRNH